MESSVWCRTLLTAAACLCLLAKASYAATPLRRVQVTCGPNLLYVDDVTTVKELRERIYEETGMDVENQGCAFFKGAFLDEQDCLSDCGVHDGAQINMLPEPLAGHFKTVTEMGKGLTKLKQRVAFALDTDETRRDKAEIRVLEGLLENLTLKSPIVQHVLEAFSAGMQNASRREVLKQPERIEMMRQVIANNPAFSGALLNGRSAVPGMTMQQTIQDPAAWRQHFLALIDRWSKMSSKDLEESIRNNTFFDAGGNA